LLSEALTPCFSEKKISSCEGYTYTQNCLWCWAVVMIPLRILYFLLQVHVVSVLLRVVDQLLKLIATLGLSLLSGSRLSDV